MDVDSDQKDKKNTADVAKAHYGGGGDAENMVTISLSDLSPISNDSILLEDDDTGDTAIQTIQKNDGNINKDNSDNNGNTNNNNNNNNSDVKDINNEEDITEATFRYKFENIFKTDKIQLSPKFYIRTMPWRLMLSVKYNTDSVGVFLQCNAENDKCWSCNAYFELRLIPHSNNNEMSVMKIRHTFTNQMNDWGFSKFMTVTDLKNPKNCYLKDDDNSIILETHVVADAPHGVTWDSKKFTGYVGLKNQGATCYMNSLLQTLFFTNQFRKIVYKMPTECDDSNKSVALGLQRVFFDLQFSDASVGTNYLTKSFGWNAVDSFMQHDVQEFLRVLMDKLESKMKNTNLDGSVPKLFEGKMVSYIRCKNIETTSQRIETYYDIQLNVKGSKNIYDSFEKYTETEILDGDNKYDAGTYGLQEAEKGVLFLSFPPVLHLHLMRFQYDPITDSSVKFNDYYEFYEEINLSPYLAKMKNNENDDDNSGGGNIFDDDNDKKNDINVNTNKIQNEEAIYKLHAVLVHSGDNNGGHYVVYIDPKLNGNWYKFDDDIVSKCRKFDAICRNYGVNINNTDCNSNNENNDNNDKNDKDNKKTNNNNTDEDNLIDKNNGNAYMLVYIRKTEISTILQDISIDDIPQEIVQHFHTNQQLEKSKPFDFINNTMLTKRTCVILDEYIESYSGIGLYDPNTISYRTFNFSKTQNLYDVKCEISNAFKIKMNKFRLWLLDESNNNNNNNNNNYDTGIQLNYIDFLPYNHDGDLEQQKQIKILHLCANLESHIPIKLFVERNYYDNLMGFNYTDDGDNNMKEFNVNEDVLIFTKHFNNNLNRFDFLFYKTYKLNTKICDLFHLINIILKKSYATTYNVFFECGINIIEKVNIENTFKNIIEYYSVKSNGIIVIFEEIQQKNQNDNASNNDNNNDNNDNNFLIELKNLTDCEHYIYKLQHKIEVLFFNKNDTNDSGFSLELYEMNTYDEMAYEVGKILNVDPHNLQFFKSQCHKNAPGTPIKYSTNEILKNIIPYNRYKQSRKLFYEKLSVNIVELENKLRFKVVMLSNDMNTAQDITLYLNKSDTIQDLLKEASNYYNFDPDGTHRLRLICVINYRAVLGPPLNSPIEGILNQVTVYDIRQKIYRVEEIPKDQINLKSNEMLISVMHLSNISATGFGTPFFIKITDGEPYSEIKSRLRIKLNISKQEFEKCKLMVVHGVRIKYVSDDEFVNFVEFLSFPNFLGCEIDKMSYIGLEYTVSSAQKRTTSSEKAIKIYN